ncbi:MAG TPA: biopolymer transporter ExbD [Candidatus Angelobacter sp.]|nr:biopolymer transporter ExbD [Candidatus Angelobacter sp.]
MRIAVRNHSNVNAKINVTPMVDVMLVLLIIFMVIMPLLQPGPQVQLARTINPSWMPDADKDDALLVAINRDGQLFLGNHEIIPAELTERIRDRIAARATKTVFVKADARTRYRSVADAVDHIRAAGVGELGLLTDRRTQ